MSLQKQIAGKHGEDVAVSYLRKQGYQIIGRNFRLRNGEIDIIAIETEKAFDTSQAIKNNSSLSLSKGLKKQQQGTLVFIEVKTRLSTDFGSPLEAIGYYKLRALTRSAEFYKSSHPCLPDEMRIDAIAIILHPDNSVVSLEHVKSITQVRHPELCEGSLNQFEHMKKIGYVYIMSSKSHVLYVGVTEDLYKRALQHKNNIIEGFTKKYHVHKLVYYEEFSTTIDAINAEKRIKGWTRKKKIALIKTKNPTFEDLVKGGYPKQVRRFFVALRMTECNESNTFFLENSR